jgi:hypothetical protein
MYATPHRPILAGLFFLLAANLSAQQADDDPQRLTLVGLTKFAVAARVQLAGASLAPLDIDALRAKLEAAIRREGIGVVDPHEVRDGTQAEITLHYMVVGSQLGNRLRFAASSCLEAAQLVRLQRRTASGGPVYAVVPTWRSCGIVTGDSLVYGQLMLQNADQQIERFIQAWRAVNESGVRSRESRVSSRQSPARRHPDS